MRRVRRRRRMRRRRRRREEEGEYGRTVWQIGGSAGALHCLGVWPQCSQAHGEVPTLTEMTSG